MANTAGLKNTSSTLNSTSELASIEFKGRGSRLGTQKLAINGGAACINSDIVKASIPSWPIVSEEAAENLKSLYLSGKWSFNGSHEQKFCQEFAEYHDAKYGIFMSNGTVTLQTSLVALGVKEGDEVIVPALTWPATAMAAIYVGAKPVFVDIEPDTLCMDPKKLNKAITNHTKAIIPVHIFGSLANMDNIMEIAEDKGIDVIEDCAQAHGGRWSSRSVGSIGKIGSFSFQQSKLLASGEGGMCITNDEHIAEKLFRLKHIGYDSASSQGNSNSKPPHGLICCNYRATEFQALILRDGLKKLTPQNALREENVKYLSKLLKEIPGVRIQSRGEKANRQSYYGLIFLFDSSVLKGASKTRLIEVLNAEGLQVHDVYKPVYKHDLWTVPNNQYRMSDNCVVCEDVCENSAVFLPHNWLLTNESIMELIAATIKKVVINNHGKL